MPMTRSSRQQALLGALLIFCIGSLLTLSLRPLGDDSALVASSPSSSSTDSTSDTTNHRSPFSSLSYPSEDKLGTGTKGTDLENNSILDLTTQDYSVMSLKSLEQLVRGTILETSENLLDPTRPVRPKGSSESVSDQRQQLQQQQQQQQQDAGQGEPQMDEDEIEGQEDRESIVDDSVVEVGPKVESLIAAGSTEGDDDLTTSDFDSVELDKPLLEQGQNQDGNQGQDQDGNQVQEDTSLTDFDVNKALPLSNSYLVFIPSGDTIEAQFFSLLTAIWIARHSNRTLIIPPPMMAPPSLYSLYPFFAGPKGRKRQRWSTLFDLRGISNLQPTVLIDHVRPVLQTPFMAEMAQEEENPTVSRQSIPYSPPADAPAGSTVPITIKCHGPPTAGSWKALDFAGRHFLNRYNLVSDFEILEDLYWDMSPESIRNHWSASLPSLASDGPENETSKNRRRQLICISGAELVGAEDPAMEETIWREVGSQISFSNTIIQQGKQSVVQILRAWELGERRYGYIGVHIDRQPHRGSCHRSISSHRALASLPSLPSGSFDGSSRKADATAGALDRLTETHGSLMPSAECLWTVELIAKRVAILQKTESVGARPVIVTTTETDPDILVKMDQQAGWLRAGAEDNGQGLFDESSEDLGGYGAEVTRAFVMANSAVFVGSRASASAVDTAFRIKNNKRSRHMGARWELY
ncbi:hypothetical protein BC939DRAFT_459508 [Gamsiella multidivaricata]|uniref:uncharacterized protein n=1 Tax=Gamsiella multidivaricata TaxID=101098 RepID=UPI002220498B|nr:uncharacterized protein BC939DRAFT_459508 [Gamsiella multidivaricata]KAG0364835.1 hypothetical protein BGZ54_007110 [Gamsiella multidivaricata]KAI7819695.1 hypothetical protein BC939DRAFT_459508 [Gamsiella multidivaricata]